MSDGWRLNLYPPGWDAVGWADFPQRDDVLRYFRDQLPRGGLAWEVVEFADAGTRRTVWVCPQSPACWLCVEGPDGGPPEVVQASIPTDDGAHSDRLAVAVVRAVCMFQLVVET